MRRRVQVELEGFDERSEMRVAPNRVFKGVKVREPPEALVAVELLLSERRPPLRNEAAAGEVGVGELSEDERKNVGDEGWHCVARVSSACRPLKTAHFELAKVTVRAPTSSSQREHFCIHSSPSIRLLVIQSSAPSSAHRLGLRRRAPLRPRTRRQRWQAHSQKDPTPPSLASPSASLPMSPSHDTRLLNNLIKTEKEAQTSSVLLAASLLNERPEPS